MKNLMKILALMLALVMSLCVFTACGKDDTVDNSGDTVGDTVADTVDIGFYDADGNKVLSGDDVFVTINGYEIPFDEYRYWYSMVDSYYFSGGDSSFWTENADLFSTLQEYTEYYVVQSNWGNILAHEYGVTLNEEDLALVETYLEEEKTYFDSIEEYEAALVESGLTEDLLRRIIATEVMGNRVYEELYNKEGALLMPSDDELKQIVADEYVRVHHILISYDHFDGLDGYEDMTDDELQQAALDYANEVLAQLQNGEADIYELAQTEGDDPGMIDNEEGYLFTYGEMVEAFETASFELEVGELSGLVETSYGWHIILRLEQDQYVEDNWETLRETIVSSVFNTDVNTVLENAQIVYNEYYDQMTGSSIK